MISQPTDRNSLLGLLALQMSFITREAFLSALQEWTADKARSMGDILVAQGALRAESLPLLQSLVKRYQELHADHLGESLASVEAFVSIHPGLDRIDACEQRVRPRQEPAPGSSEAVPLTRPPEAGAPPSWGLRFRIVRPHAKGGLGEVFVAYDEELQREVALKRLQECYADQPESRARFLREARIASQLEHSGIVPVYGMGSLPDGRLYYAMRFLRGQSLQDAIGELHRADAIADPAERFLALNRLLGQLIDVCYAMAYAHSRGVLHRDLKPGNILLGSFGETLVIDWGLARRIGRPGEEVGVGEAPPTVIEEGGLTEQGAVLGTPVYTSPEQAAGRLDQMGPASDVYSLGATLYHLLTGRPPFSGGDEGQILQSVQRGDFPPPRSSLPGVTPSLEAICRKAMALRPEQRYASPLGLAEDLERWRSGQTVAAFRPERKPGLAGWARRRLFRRRTMAALLLLAVIGLAVVASPRFLPWRRHAQPLPEQQVGAADPAPDAGKTEATSADDPTAQATQWRQRGGEHYRLAQWTEALDAFSKAVEIHPGSWEGWYGRGITHARLEHWKEAIADLTETLRRNPEHSANVWNERGTAKGNLGQWDEAVRDYSEAIRLKPDETVFWSNRAAAYGQLGQWEKAWADYTEVLKRKPADIEARKNRSVVLSNLGKRDEALEDLAEAIRLNPRDASARDKRGTIHEQLGKLEAALADYTAAIQLEPTTLEYRRKRANVYQVLNQWDNAFADLAECLRVDPSKAEYWRDRGIFYGLRGQYDRALADAEEALKRNPKDETTWLLRGVVQHQLGHLEKALADLNRAVECAPQNAGVYKGRAQVYRTLKEDSKFFADISRAIELRPDDPSLWAERSSRYSELRQWDKALADCDKAVALAPRDASLWNERGVTHLRSGHPDKGLLDLSKAAELDPKWYLARRNCGAAHALLGRWQEAAADYVKATALDDCSIAEWSELALVRLALGDQSGHREVCAELLRRYGKTDNPIIAADVIRVCTRIPAALSDYQPLRQLLDRVVVKHPQRREFLQASGRVLYRTGKLDEAIHRFDEAAKIPDQEVDPRDQLFVGMAYYKLGQIDKAKRVLEEAFRVVEQKLEKLGQERKKDGRSGLMWEQRELELIRSEAKSLPEAIPTIRPKSASSPTPPASCTISGGDLIDERDRQLLNARHAMSREEKEDLGSEAGSF